MQSFIFNQTNLIAVAVANTDRFSSGFQMDDVNLTATAAAVTPIPPALALFTTALAGLGFAGWRRKNRGA